MGHGTRPEGHEAHRGKEKPLNLPSDLSEIEKILATHFDWHGCQVKSLVGYANSNYLIRKGNDRYVFKTYSYSPEQLAIVSAENDLLQHLQQNSIFSRFPEAISNNKDQFIFRLKLNGQPLIGRMLTFLTGDFSGDAMLTEQSAKSLGTFLAEMDLALGEFDHPIFRGRVWEWDIQHLSYIKPMVADIPDAHDQSIVRYFIQQFDTQVRDQIPYLRKQIIHNDANEWNLLQQGDQISGIIDFGDATHTPLINELAIALTYACYTQQDPLEWMPVIVKSYHETLPLQEKEIDLLYYLIAARLCLSVCNAARAKKEDPDNGYATVSEEKAWSMLHHWVRISPLKVSRLLRVAVGIEVPEMPDVSMQLKQRNKYLSSILSVSYAQPIHMDRAAFQFMHDGQGNTFLDAYNNIPHVGHCHPHVTERATAQMARLNTNTRYLYDQLAAYAAQLLDHFPAPLNKLFFVNSGSAATDLALRLVRQYTDRNQIMVLEHGYHGNTQLGIDVSDYKFNHPKGQGQRPYILKTTLPDAFRGKYQGQDAGSRYAKDAIQSIESAAGGIAGFIAEPIVGCGGQVPLASGYLKPVYEVIRAQGGLCISDEVQTGFGRVGDHFWGFEMQDVVPDMVILGKPMGNGHPMGAVVTTNEVAAAFEKGVEFFSSFGGNPVSCAVGQAVLDVIKDEQLQARAKTIGAYYQQQLNALAADHPEIGEVRGSGLFLGIDIVHPDTTDTNRPLATHIKNYLRNHHILISTDGPDDSVLKTKPPLCFDHANVDQVVHVMDQAIRAYEIEK